MKRKHWLIIVGTLSLLYLAGLLYYAQVRSLEPDEGFYPLAARLAWEGKVPYRDFMFSQGAAIAYIYSWIWGVHPQSLVAMRFLSVTLGAVTVFLWGYFLFSVKRWSAGVAFWMFVIILLNPFWISLHTIFKTFAVGDLLMSVVLICLYLGIHSGRAKWYLIAGVALGLCASARALYGPLLVFVLAWLVFLDWKEQPVRRFLRARAYLAGAACGVLPMLFSFAADPRAFLFNNFQYRRILNNYAAGTFSQTMDRRLRDIHYLLTHRFFAAELILALLGIISLLELRKKKTGPYTNQDFQFLLLAFLMMVVYSATALMPLPVWAQYYDAPLLPFLIFFMAEGLRVAFQVSWKWAVVVAILTPILCRQGVRVEEGESEVSRLELSSYRQVAQIVRANTGPDSVVLSIWPGYVFESGRKCFPGGENEFVYFASETLSPELRKRLHLISRKEVLTALTDGVPDIYIPPPPTRYITMADGYEQAFRNALNAKYSLIKQVDDMPIYRKNR
jgi:hypothetical protein